MSFLFREGAQFVPMYRDSLQLYRMAGLEYADVLRNQIARQQAFSREFNQLRLDALNHYEAQGMTPEVARTITVNIEEYRDSIRDTLVDHEKLAKRLGDRVVEERDQEISNQNLKTGVELYREQGDNATADEYEAMISPVDFEAVAAFCKSTLPEYRALNQRLAQTLPAAAAAPLDLPTPKMEQRFAEIRDGINAYVQDLPQYIQQAEAWDPSKSVPLLKGFTAFITGRDWLTASYWQDFYGILPLFCGSIMISTLALSIAVPLSVAAAIYVNQIATPQELSLIKPYIEFIEALPSIVLGFFGIVVLGSFLRDVSQIEWLSWFPGFPMSERLTIATAGVLLALMAVPTIFTLVEDSLNNVPRHYVEASYALGANKMQTIFKIMVPAALSGIVSAVLLGLGRVIGETMVVLLCAGGMIAIPDFTQGIGAFFQPAHTMTGIIAQELGEVDYGSLHYRALFMVGIVLFFISLLLNYSSQFIIKKFSIGE
ncbi:MAG: phosphate ABC transporter permease subunit PstC [Verrucomicrobiota bacterium]